jgi:hypothetical protein
MLAVVKANPLGAASNGADRLRGSVEWHFDPVVRSRSGELPAPGAFVLASGREGRSAEMFVGVDAASWLTPCRSGR